MNTTKNTTTIIIIVSNTGTEIAVMSLAAVVVFVIVIAIALFIVLPPGFCSRRARWIRKLTSTMNSAGKVLMEEIRGEEEVDIDSDDEKGKKEQGETVEETAARQANDLPSKWVKMVMNHDSVGDPEANAARDRWSPTTARVGLVNANKTGSAQVYF